MRVDRVCAPVVTRLHATLTLTTISRVMQPSSLPTSATQAKDRNYMQLGHSLARLSRAVGQTADLCELMKVNLDAMKVLAATHAAE